MRPGAALISLALSASAAAADTLHGTVVDKSTGAPVAGAIVTVGSELVASDDTGHFDVTLPAGKYVVEITAPWLKGTRQRVALHGEASLVIEVVAADRPSGETIEVVDIAPTAPGQTVVDAKLARAVPGGGDAAKVVQSLPAVARPAAGSTEVVVWGAAPNDTRTFVDGVPVPALYHVGGYRSAIGNDLIGTIGLTPAAFGVDRGGAIGGVIDIGLADPSSVPEWRVQADVLDAAASGRVTLGEMTVAAAVRQSWLDQAIGVIEDPARLAPNTPLPKWTDGQIVARAPLGERTVLTAWVIASLE